MFICMFSIVYIYIHTHIQTYMHIEILAVCFAQNFIISYVSTSTFFAPQYVLEIFVSYYKRINFIF